MYGRLLLAITLAAGTGCGPGRVLGANVDDPPAIRAAVRAVVPPGSSFDSAAARLRREGFQCVQLEQRPGAPWSGYCHAVVAGDRPLRNRVLGVEYFSRDTFDLTRPPPPHPLRVDSLEIRVIEEGDSSGSAR